MIHKGKMSSLTRLLQQGVGHFVRDQRLEYDLCRQDAIRTAIFNRFSECFWMNHADDFITAIIGSKTVSKFMLNLLDKNDFNRASLMQSTFKQMRLGFSRQSTGDL